MKATELQTKSHDELNTELLSLLKAKFGLRMQLATQQSNNTAEMRKLRRDIARVKTVMHQKANAK